MKFFPEVNKEAFLELERRYSFILSMYKNIYEHELQIPKEEITYDYEDVLFEQDEISIIQDKLKESNRNRKSAKEYQYLIDRNFTDKMIEDMGIGFYSHGWSDKEFELMGATLHPMLENVFNSQLKEGLIIPFYENGKLINVVSRKLEQGPLKYCNSVPDVDIYNFDSVQQNEEEIWLTEGVFDCKVLMDLGYKCISVSSASLSSIQIYKILEKNPKTINIFCDYDYTGLRNASVLKRIFRMYGVTVKTYISEKCKDVCEHFLENDYTFDEVEEVGITQALLDILEPEETEKVKGYFSYMKDKYIPI